MDPNAAFKAMINAWLVNDYRTAREYADDLRTWLAGGGFPPSAPYAREWIDTVLSERR